MKLTNRLIIVLAFFALLFTSSATAQVDVATATLKGTITDQAGAFVPGVKVTATSVERGLAKNTVTDVDGVYQIPLLQPGKYEVKMEADGFKTYLWQNLTLTIGQVAVLDVKLEVGDQSAEVVVTTEAPLIETERTQQSNTIEQRQIAALPNISRSFTDYIFTLPGVADSSVAFTQNASRTLRNTPSTSLSIGG